MKPTTTFVTILQLAVTVFAQRRCNGGVATRSPASICVLDESEHVDLGSEGFFVETVKPNNWWYVIIG